MAKTGAAVKKIETSKDVLRRYLHGSSLATARISKAAKSSGGKKKGRAKKFIRVPIIGGWPGGHEDINGKDRHDTYRHVGAMRLTQTCNRHKVMG